MARYVDTAAIIQVIGNIYNNVSLLDYEDYHFNEDDFPEQFHKLLFGSIFNNRLIRQSCKSSVLPGTVSKPAGLWMTIKSSSRCIRCSVRKLLKVQSQADREKQGGHDRKLRP